MIKYRYKRRIESLREIDSFYKNLAIEYAVNEPLVRTVLNKKATAVYYFVYKEYERDERLIHDRFADIYAHSGEILYYRRSDEGMERGYDVSDFKSNRMPTLFAEEIDKYIDEILKMLNLSWHYR